MSPSRSATDSISRTARFIFHVVAAGLCLAAIGILAYLAAKDYEPSRLVCAFVVTCLLFLYYLIGITAYFVSSSPYPRTACCTFVIEWLMIVLIALLVIFTFLLSTGEKSRSCYIEGYGSLGDKECLARFDYLETLTMDVVILMSSIGVLHFLMSILNCVLSCVARSEEKKARRQRINDGSISGEVA